MVLVIKLDSLSLSLLLFLRSNSNPFFLSSFLYPSVCSISVEAMSKEEIMKVQVLSLCHSLTHLLTHCIYSLVFFPWRTLLHFELQTIFNFYFLYTFYFYVIICLHCSLNPFICVVISNNKLGIFFLGGFPFWMIVLFTLCFVLLGCLYMQKCVLKVNIHCDGCKQKVKKILQKIDGTLQS